jgi:hypothetical protein
LPQPAKGAGPVNVTGGGTFTGKSAVIKKPIQLKEGGRDLVVVVKEDLDVLANILFPPRMQRPNAPSLNITLVSLEGKVTIAKGVRIGGGMAANGIRGAGRAMAGDGVQGGNIKIVGVNIDVQGSLEGNRGGAGGSYTLIGGSDRPLLAGDGGTGGGICLCALDTIRLNSAVAGKGGSGGNTVVTQDRQVALNGSFGGDGGQVLIHGSDPGGANVQVQIGTAAGGDGSGGGGAAAAAFTFGSRSGANAIAWGGMGGSGGTVRFRQAEVIMPAVVRNSRWRHRWPGRPRSSNPPLPPSRCRCPGHCRQTRRRRQRHRDLRRRRQWVGLVPERQCIRRGNGVGRSQWQRRLARPACDCRSQPGRRCGGRPKGLGSAERSPVVRVRL